ncbi:MAG: hypothetical protein IIX16_03825 [Clostridia bacterium]|nr:hypothetical protein [Clostridia bacterium]
MKKIIALLLVVVLCFTCVACGKKTQNQELDDNHSESTTKTDNTIYQFGDTVTVNEGKFEFTPVFEGFAEKLANWPDENYLTPEGLISGKTPYEASEDKVMMYFSGTINYIGNSKTNETFNYTFIVDYNDGYIFDFANGEAWNRGKGYHSGCGITDDIKNGDWEYKTLSTFEPLSSNKTRYVRFCIEVPYQLEAEREKVIVKFNINGEEIKFTLAQ